MKKSKVFFSLLLMMVLALSQGILPAAASEHSEEPYYVTAYHVDIDVSEDNVFSITEEIDVFFNEEQHGIYREIPTRNKIKRADGSEAVTRAKVRDISCSEEYDKEKYNGSVCLYIGDPDATVIGEMHYTLSYEYVLGRDVADGYDELYFNIIGDGWTSYIDNVSFTITMPKEFDESLLGFSTGGYGAAGTDIVEYSVDGVEIAGALTQELAPHEALTVRLELEEGYFYFNELLHLAKIGTMVFFPLLSLLFAWFAWWKFGRDQKIIETVEFYPPEGMNSVDVSYWYKGTIPKKDVVAILIELANEGYIAIHEEEVEGVKGVTRYVIERVKTYPYGQDEVKRLFFEGLFESGKERVTGNDLKNKFYLTINQILAEYHRAGAKKGEIHTLLSLRLQLLCWALVLACFIANLAIVVSVLAGGEKFIPFVLGILVLFAVIKVARHIPKRTEESHKNLEKITGFKKFLETAEKDRLEVLVNEDPKYFYGILPYAYVLGVSEQWVNKFEGIAIAPPEWYSGHGAFTTATMWHSMSQTMSSAASAMTSSPSHSSSGGSSSGGGGVSGGGSGGGGGGSW